jgi:hypothetical protein
MNSRQYRLVNHLGLLLCVLGACCLCHQLWAGVDPNCHYQCDQICFGGGHGCGACLTATELANHYCDTDYSLTYSPTTLYTATDQGSAAYYDSKVTSVIANAVCYTIQDCHNQTNHLNYYACANNSYCTYAPNAPDGKCSECTLSGTSQVYQQNAEICEVCDPPG